MLHMVRHTCCPASDVWLVSFGHLLLVSINHQRHLAECASIYCRELRDAQGLLSAKQDDLDRARSRANQVCP